MWKAKTELSRFNPKELLSGKNLGAIFLSVSQFWHVPNYSHNTVRKNKYVDEITHGS